MSALVLDAGALIAVDRNDRAMLARLRAAERHGLELRTNAMVVARSGAIRRAVKLGWPVSFRPWTSARSTTKPVGPPGSCWAEQEPLTPSTPPSSSLPSPATGS